jgi:hypothetical protein
VEGYKITNCRVIGSSRLLNRWEHTEHQPEIGRRYWNWVHYHFPDSVLTFSDGADYGGTLQLTDESGTYEARF